MSTPPSSIEEVAKACAFCEIGQRHIDSGEGHPDGVFALVPLNPVTEGHLLVIPFRHVRDALDDPELTGKVMQYAAYTARDRQPCNIITSVGSEATQSVFHLHVHIVPRRKGDGLALPWSKQ